MCAFGRVWLRACVCFVDALNSKIGTGTILEYITDRSFNEVYISFSKHYTYVYTYVKRTWCWVCTQCVQVKE